MSGSQQWMAIVGKSELQHQYVSTISVFSIKLKKNQEIFFLIFILNLHRIQLFVS